MDEHRRRITEDLAGMLEGDLDCRPATSAVYASDASIYQIMPLGVAFPRCTEDVVLLSRYSSEHGVPLFARGAGTGIAGQALGRGLIVDFARYLNGTLAVGENTVRVQPGIVRDELNRALKAGGRYFPPDPSNTAITTVGGMMGVDAAGSRSVRVGSTRDHVASVEMVLAGGRRIEFGLESQQFLRDIPPPSRVEAAGVGGPSDDSVFRDRGVKRTIISKLAKILGDNRELIAEKQPPLLRNCSGYCLRGVLRDQELHLPRLLVGSEGTLGLFTETTLHTSPLPKHRGVVLLLFGQLEAAIRTVLSISRQQPTACDLLDRRLLTLAREADPRFESLISPVAEAALLVEHTGTSDRAVRDRIRGVVTAVHDVNLRAIVASEAYSPDEDAVEFLWSLPGKVVPLLTRLRGETRPIPFVEDVAVPPESLHDFLVAAQRVFQKHEVTATVYAHAAAGQVHLRPFLPTPGPHDGARLEAIAREVYGEAISFGGTISGEHGDGLSRTAFLRTQYGPLYRVFRDIKDLFDPHNLMNPGKIVSDDPHITQRNIRPTLEPAAELVQLNLRWSPEELADAASRCNGCGNCRTQSPGLRMCPFFRLDQSETAAPRSKANLARNLISGHVEELDISSPEVRELADLCFNCKQCQLECPSNVNIPQMMIEAKAAHVAVNGLKRSDWVLSRAHSLGFVGSAAWMATNWAIRNPAMRWMMERLLGISRKRKLPLFARRPFLRTMDRDCRRPPHPGERDRTIVYFVSEYANYYDPELAHSLVSVFRHNGYRVHVPPGQTSSGMAMISAGDLEAARELVETNIQALAELARDGYPIVCSEPSAAVALKHEYPMISDHPDVQLVASRVVEAGRLLRELHRRNDLKTDFDPLNVEAGYHTPCHLKALTADSPLAELLSLIPGLELHRIETGCSGMAGAFGLTRENFSTSIQMGWPLISRMRAGDFNIGTTECSSCKLQMEQGTATPTLHPLKLLALAYGLMPEIGTKLQLSKSALTVT
ncbi:MAG: anaerobic glycerol-3-phosphate dehydrogenase subunit C [Planctomycetaceae bacterium]